jgi:hypothetical protein
MILTPFLYTRTLAPRPLILLLFNSMRARANSLPVFLVPPVSTRSQCFVASVANPLKMCTTSLLAALSFRTSETNTLRCSSPTLNAFYVTWPYQGYFHPTWTVSSPTFSVMTLCSLWDRRASTWDLSHLFYHQQHPSYQSQTTHSHSVFSLVLHTPVTFTPFAWLRGFGEELCNIMCRPLLHLVPVVGTPCAISSFPYLLTYIIYNITYNVLFCIVLYCTVAWSAIYITFLRLRTRIGPLASGSERRLLRHRIMNRLLHKTFLAIDLSPQSHRVCVLSLF